MMISSVDLYRDLRGEVGLETGWHEVGLLRLASSEERMDEMRARPGGRRRSASRSSWSRPTRRRRALPAAVHRRVLGAAHLPTDGYIDPSQLTFALAEAPGAAGPRSLPIRG